MSNSLRNNNNYENRYLNQRGGAAVAAPVAAPIAPPALVLGSSVPGGSSRSVGSSGAGGSSGPGGSSRSVGSSGAGGTGLGEASPKPVVDTVDISLKKRLDRNSNSVSAFIKTLEPRRSRSSIQTGGAAMSSGFPNFTNVIANGRKAMIMGNNADGTYNIGYIDGADPKLGFKVNQSNIRLDTSPTSAAASGASAAASGASAAASGASTARSVGSGLVLQPRGNNRTPGDLSFLQPRNVPKRS
jgi:hypothetical protein